MFFFYSHVCVVIFLSFPLFLESKYKDVFYIDENMGDIKRNKFSLVLFTLILSYGFNESKGPYYLFEYTCIIIELEKGNMKIIKL